MATKRLIRVPYESIIVDPSFNARTNYKGIDELKTSIMDSGLLQPVGLVAKKGPDDSDKYYLVYGFRRMLAIGKIKEELGPDAYAEIDAVLNEGTLEELRDRNVKENIDRESLDTHEIAQVVKRMANAGLEQRDIAKRLGRPQSWVSYHYKIATKLAPSAQKALEEGKLTMEQALNIADVPESEQDEIVNSVVNADTRSEARKIVKEAAKESGTKRVYANKGKPTAKNVAKLVSDASFDAESPGMSEDEASFYNGVVAGLRLALGDLEYDKLSFKEGYADCNFHTKNEKPKAEKKKSTTKVLKAKGTTRKKSKAAGSTSADA